jgi:S-DNA-T family DNA segregation ATPase FtsK/SpoIIIE
MLIQLPYLVLVIDELADVLGGDKRGEAKIAGAKLGRIVQKSRAAGVHVIAATQRPSVNIVAGSIKSNFPVRLTFRLPSEMDSRTVISTGGAEHLLSQGDMLYDGPASGGLKRLHAAYASIDDIKQCVDVAKLQATLVR